MYNNLPYNIIEGIEGGNSGSGGISSLGFGASSFRHGGTTSSSSSSSSSSSPSSESSESRDYKGTLEQNYINETTGDNYKLSTSYKDRLARANALYNKKPNVYSDKNLYKSNKLVVAFPIYGEPMSYINNMGEYDGLTYYAWKAVENSLKKNTNYEIEYKLIKEPKIDDMIDGLKSRKYDIVIGDYGTNPEFMQFVSYSSPFMSIKDVGVYPDETDTQFEYRVIKRIGSVLLWPFIGLVLLSLISSIYAWTFSKKTNVAGAFVQMMNGILGDRGALMTGTQFTVKPGRGFVVWFVSIILLIVSFAFLFYLQSIAISKSIDVIQKNKDPFIYPEGKKILVPRGSTAIKTLQECCGVITIEAKSKETDVKTISKEFLERFKKENIAGFYHSGPEVAKWIETNPNFVMSDTKFSVPSPVSFMVSKFRPELLYDINKSIAEINWEGLLNNKCEEFIGRLCFSSQY